jgi:3-methyladenine DNA glycosylase AlkD
MIATATPGRAASERRYLKSDLAFIGTTVPDMRIAVKAWLREHRGIGHDDLLAVVDALWQQPVHELRTAAIELLVLQPKLVDAGDLPWIEAHLRECATWALVDPLAGSVASRIMAADPSALAVTDRWLTDDEMWIRRSAVLALRDSLRGGEQLDRLFAYADELIGETEFFIRKVLGWVLREEAGRHPEAVSAWLRRQMPVMNMVTMREPCRKLPDADELLEAYGDQARRKRSG